MIERESEIQWETNTQKIGATRDWVKEKNESHREDEWEEKNEKR